MNVVESIEHSRLKRRPHKIQGLGGNTGQPGHRYHKYIRCLGKSWPQLRLLDDFMSHVSHEISKRCLKNVIQVDVSAVQVSFKEVDQLGLSFPNSGLRILLLEDLTPDLIEAIGSTFDVDPLFFSAHLYDQDWFSRHSSPATVSSSATRIRERRFQQIRYLETRPLKACPKQDQKPMDYERERCSSSNVVRNVSILKLSSTEGLMGFSRRQLTVWVHPDNNVGMCYVLSLY
jgi:hypothetical protein